MIGLTAAGAQLIVREAHFPCYTVAASFLRLLVSHKHFLCFVWLITTKRVCEVKWEADTQHRAIVFFSLWENVSPLFILYC